MSLTRRIAHNTLIQIIGKAIVWIIGILTIGLMTRYLGREGFGYYTTIIAFLQFFGIFVDFGLSVVMNQLISARPDETEKLTSNIFTFRLVTAFILFALAPLVVWFFPYPTIIKWGVVVTSAALFFTSLNQVLIALFQRELKMMRATLAEIIGRLIILLGVILAVYQGWSLLMIMAGVVAGNLIQFILVFYFSSLITKIRLAFEKDVWVEVFKKSWPIGVSIIFNLVYFKADTVILSLYRSQAEVGIYGVTYKILEILSSLPYMFMGLILPLLAGAWAVQDRERFFSVLQKTWDKMSLITFPMVVGGFILATPIVVLVAGPDFYIAGPIFQILIFATGAIFFSTVFTHAVVALEAQKKILKGFMAVAVISLVSYFIFIPRYSYWGAAAITVLSEMLMLLISGFITLSITGNSLKFKIFTKAFLASLIMGLVLYLLNNLGVNLILLIFGGGIIYILVLYVLGGIEKEFIDDVLNRQKL